MSLAYPTVHALQATCTLAAYHRIGLLVFLLTAFEAVAAPLIATGSLIGSTQLLGVPLTEPYIFLAIFSALLCYTFIQQDTVQPRDTLVSGWTIATRVGFAWASVVALLLLIGYATNVSELFSRRALFLWFVGTAPLLMGTPIMLRQCFRRLAVGAGNTRSAVIAGVNPMSRELARNIVLRPELGLEHHGFFDDRCPDRVADSEDVELAGSLGDVANFAKRRRIDVIFIALPYHLERTKALLNDLRDTTASVYLIPDISFLGLLHARANHLHGVPVIALCETPLQGWRGFKKRATDIVLASLMLVAAIPLMLPIAAAIKLTSPGPAICRERRYTLDGEPISVYRFRTSAESDECSPAETTSTRVGRFLKRYSLDELPKLLNVLQGRMSLVGPRPHAVAHDETYRQLIDGYLVTHKVAPGLTGLAQIHGYLDESLDAEAMKRRLDYDLDYLRHWSLGLDIKILVKTLTLLFRNQKAY